MQLLPLSGLLQGVLDTLQTSFVSYRWIDSFGASMDFESLGLMYQGMGTSRYIFLPIHPSF